LPDLVKVAGENPSMDVLLVSYDLQLPRADRSTVVERVSQFVGERQWNLPVAIVEAEEIDAVNERFDLPGGIPVTLAFDRFGRIADREDGPCDHQRFTALAVAAR
jgi:hypothetical protein